MRAGSAVVRWAPNRSPRRRDVAILGILHAFRPPVAVASELTAAESRSALRVSAAHVRVASAPAHPGISMSFASMRRRALVLVELRTAQGLVGYGESWANYPSWAPAERVATLEKGVFPLVIGEEIDDVPSLHRKLMSRLLPLGRQWGAVGPIMQAVSAVDMAAWDLLAKSLGLAISDVVGAVRQAVPVYASGVGPTDLSSQVAVCRSLGYRAIKLRLGFGRDRDSRILAEVREAAGPNVELYADANQAWDLEEAVAMSRILRKHGVTWIEEPIRGNRLRDLEAFYRRSGIPIATGENLYGIDAFASYAESDSICALQPDVSKNGGLTELLAICRMAESKGKDVIPHFYGGAVALAATLQLAGCCSAVQLVEHDFRPNPLRESIWVDAPQLRDSSLTVPTTPGLGVLLDGDVVATLTEEVN